MRRLVWRLYCRARSCADDIYKACQRHVGSLGRNKIAFPLVTCASAKALARSGSAVMPLVRFLDNSFGPEAITAMTAAFEDTLRTLGLVDHNGLATEIVAKKIIELAQQGECDPIRLRDRAVQSLSE